MILKSLTHDWHESTVSVETDLGVLRFRRVQASHTLNSAPWGKSSFCKELRIIRGDDISIAVFFMESRDVLTVTAEEISSPEAIGDHYPAVADAELGKDFAKRPK